jgi:hypothetical protein
MYANAKMMPVEAVPGIRGGGMRDDILIHCKKLCKCYPLKKKNKETHAEI